MADYDTPRRNMVESQIRPNRVTDPAILDAMSALPRELFVPEPLRGIAYIDEDIEIASARYLMEPMVMARLLQVAEVTDEDIILDVGCGTGYSTSVLAKLGHTVVAVESDPALAARATELLGELDIDNAAVMTGPLDEGYAEQAPYDVIFLGGGVEKVPQAILEQMAENGRLVTVVFREEGITGEGTLMVRQGKNFSSRAVFDASVPPLPGFISERKFIF